MIGYYLHSQGQGHRRRGTAVARELREPVVGLGSGGPPPGWPGDWVELARDDDPAVPDLTMADVTAHGVLHWAPLGHEGLLARHAQLVDWLAATWPALVVVDVSVEVALLVRLCGVPVVVAAMPGARTDRAHRLAYDLAEALLAPWPAGAHPDVGWPTHWRDKTWEVGGVSVLRARDAPPEAPADVAPAGVADAPTAPVSKASRRVLLLWGSGGDDLGGVDLHAAQAATPGWEWVIRGGGHPRSRDLWADLIAADVVVCHAGQGAVADVAMAGRPAVVLAQPRPHGEQAATARALDRMGIAVTGSGWPANDAWPDLLERAATLGGQGWRRWRGDGDGDGDRDRDGASRAAALLDVLATSSRRPQTVSQ